MNIGTLYYYLTTGGKTEGPLTEVQMKALLKKCLIGWSTRVCAAGEAQWVPLAAHALALKLRPPTKGWLDWLFGTAKGLALVGLAVCLLLGQFARWGLIPQDYRSEAWSEATKYVSFQLKAPSTAHFAPPEECVINVTGNDYVVAGWVEAQNSFGVPLRQTFGCEMRREGGDWVPIKTEIR